MLRDFTKDRFDIIIQAGQSNSEGYGFGPVDAPYEPNGRVWYLNGDFTISMAAEKATLNDIQSNFSLPFAREYLNAGLLEDGRDLLIVRSAVGGTGFLDNRWKPQDDLFLRMLDMTDTAVALNPDNRIVALLWHQGETDSSLHSSYETYYDNLSTLYRLTAERYGVKDLPFVAGDFVRHWKDANSEICAPVIAAMRDVCRDCGGAFVETDGLKSNNQELSYHPLGWEDPIHFSRRSIYELGKRYFEAYRRVSGR
ncbi:MAG: sialate O-acetylesterase [Clostridiales bacterium]|nr:sialate O-acetylesterase [Clostridiales bacterium]